MTDVKLFGAAPPPRVIRVEFPIDLSPGSQAIAAQGDLLDDPWDIEIVPEPLGGGLTALVALIALAPALSCGVGPRDWRDASAPARFDRRIEADVDHFS